MMKGVSQFIGASLLVAVAISMTAVYTQFAQDLSRGAAGGVVNNSENDLRCRNAAIDISDARYFRVRSDLNFTVSNTGTIRFSQPVRTVVIGQNGTIVNRQQIEEFSVSETRNQVLDLENPPSKVVATSEDCPEITSEEEVTVSSSG